MAHYEGSAPSRIFYGWWVASAFSLIIFLSTGIRFAVGPFLKPVVSDLGLDRGTFSLVISLSLFLYGAFMPLVGPLVDRWGSRLVCSLGAIVMAGSLVLTGTMTSLWQFALYYGVLGALGLAATGQVVALATLTRWFARRRGTAVSLLSVASMAGISLLVPIVMWCILRFGWRASYMILGVASLLVTLPLSIWVLRDSPEDIGLHPDGRMPAMSLLSAHGVPMLTDHGFHEMTASSAIGFLGMSSIAGGMLLGVLSDSVGRKPTLASVYLIRVAAFSLLFFVHEPVALMVVAAFGGIGMAGSLALTSAMSADIFGRFSTGSIFSLIFLIHQMGSALGAWLAGFLFDLFGGYGPAFGVSCALLIVGAGLSLTINMAGRPRARALLQPVAAGR
jgi:MFS family permease